MRVQRAPTQLADTLEVSRRKPGGVSGHVQLEAPPNLARVGVGPTRNENIVQFFSNFDSFLPEEALWQISEAIRPRGNRY